MYTMTYNIHPIIVHFPIALLFIYSLIIIFPIERWFKNTSFTVTRRVLIILGFLGILASMSSGEAAQDFTSGSRDVIHAHEAFASASSWLYGLLLAGELLPFVIKWLPTWLVWLSPILNFCSKVLRNTTIVWLLALGGLLVLTITGMLGGILVHGTSADPLAPMLLNILGLN